MFKLREALEMLDSDIPFRGLDLGHKDIPEAALANFINYCVFIQDLEPARTESIFL